MRTHLIRKPLDRWWECRIQDEPEIKWENSFDLPKIEVCAVHLDLVRPKAEQPMMIKSPVVVFDLGGVIVRICHTWQQALLVAGIGYSKLGTKPIPLIDFPDFNLFQSNDLPYEAYLESLSEYLGVSVEDARRVHVGILREPYPGIEAMVQDLKSSGIATGCLSNTNGPHWQELTETEEFKVVAMLDFRAGSHELGYAKPDPRAFQAFEVQFGIDRTKIVFFDDNNDNVEAARRSGWTAHLIDPEGDPAEQICLALSRDLVIPN